jgi:hypothetical protein
MTIEKRIAKVESTFLGVEDHGILTAIIGLDYGSAGQGAGLYTFDTYNKPREGIPYAPMYDSDRVGSAYGMEWIRRVLEAFGVDQWESLIGRTIFAHSDHSHVYGFEPLPTERGKKFMFDELDVLANTRLVTDDG